MSTERESGAGAYGAQAPGGAPWEHPDAPAAQPNVYLPQAPAPAYEGYADPAAAHGWQNAYDETRELPPLTDPDEPLEPADGAGPGPGYGPVHGVAGPGQGSGHGSGRGSGRGPGEGRAERRRAERRSGGRRRVAVVAGTLGVAGAVAVIAALAGGSDSPGPDGSSPADGGHVAVDDSATRSPRTDAGSPSGPASTQAGGSAPAASPASGAPRSRTPAAPPSATTPGAPTSAPGTTAPGPTASASGAPGDRGRGHGAGRNRH